MSFVSRLTAQAWEDLHKYDSGLIRQSFIDLGPALSTDGSKDRKIKIKGLPGITVGDWQSWKSQKLTTFRWDNGNGDCKTSAMDGDDYGR